jgi:two-component system, NarL family, nitrate/nitrite response regulator NarL
MIKLLIADDHKLVIDGYVSILRDVDNIQVIGTASNGKEVLTLMETEQPDVILLDINMPVMDGIDTTRNVKMRRPNTKILILTMYNDSGLVKRLVALGVDGYILKNCTKKTLIDAIECVIDGKPYYDEDVTETILSRFQQQSQTSAGMVSLSQRELQIIRLIALGHTTTEIAKALDLSPHTIKTHRRNINQKLDIHSPAGLVQFAYANQLVGN